MRKLKLFSLLMLLFVGVTTMWAAEGDTHDFAQTGGNQGLNNCATINGASIAAQSYPVKEVIVSVAYNKTNSPTVSVSVGGVDWGTKTLTKTTNLSTYETYSFTGDATIGAVVITLENDPNNCSSTGRGSVNLGNVRLVEGASVAPAFTITPATNDENMGTVSINGSVITGSPKAGYRYADPAYTVTTGTASVEQGTGENINKFTVTPTTDCTIQINFEAIPTHKIHFNTNDLVEIDDATVAEGAIYNITESPAASLGENCTYNTFVGWTLSSSIPDANVKPALVSSVTMSTSDVTLNAVYSKTVSSEANPTAYTAGDEGDFVLASYNSTEEAWYAIPSKPTLSSGKIAGVEITVNKSSGNVDYVLTDDADGYLWTITDATNGQTISDGSNYLYHSNGGSSGTNLAYGNSTTYTWKIESETNGLTFKGMSGSTTNSRGMLMSGTTFGGYALSNEDASGYYRISVLPIASNGTTTYSLDAQCAASGTCVTPSISPATGTYNVAQEVTITTATEGATIYYTTNGDDPTNESTEYSSAIEVNSSLTIKAIAIKDGMTNSEIASASYILQPTTPLIIGDKEAIISDNYFDAASIEITITTSGGAKIYYTTDGNNPTNESTEYTAPFNITETTTIKAIAIKSGWTNSEIAEQEYVKFAVTNCATASIAALSVSANNEEYNDGEVFTIRGYVTDISKYSTNSYFWIADEQGTEKVLEVYHPTQKGSGELALDNYVEVKGTLTKYNSTPEFAAGCEFEILDTPTAIDNAEVEGKAVKVLRNGILYIEKGGKQYNVMGQLIK